MTQATISQPQTSPRSARRLLGARVLVGTVGAESGDAALAVAGQLAERDGGTLHAVAVVEPLPAYAVGLAEIAVADVQEQRRAATAQALRLQLERVGHGAQWTWTVALGHPADRIAALAAAEHASLIVLGLDHHRGLERMLSGETALHVIRRASVPVLAVPPRAAFPHRALVAVDFSEASLGAARLAIDLLGPTCVLTLAHVQPVPAVHAEDRVTWAEVYADGARRRLGDLRAQLEDGWRGRTDTVLLSGEPSHALLEFAARGRYDVLALGAHAQSAIERLLAGSVATHLVRSAGCALLVAPAGRAAAGTT